MIQPGTHGVDVVSGEKTAKSFRKSAYALGSAKVRSRYAYDPGPSPIPPGGASLGAFAAKMGSSILAARNNRDLRARETADAAGAEEKQSLELQVLRQKLNPQTFHHLTPDGQGLDLTTEQELVYQNQRRDREPTPERVHNFTAENNPLGLPIREGGWPESEMGQYLMDRRAGENRNAALKRAQASASRPRFGTANSLLNSQETEINRKIEEHTQKDFRAYKTFADDWLQKATSGDEAAIRHLGIDPKILRKIEDPEKRTTALSKAHERLLDQHMNAHRRRAQSMFSTELDRIRGARSELGNAVGEETGIDLDGAEEPAVRPEIQAILDKLGGYGAPR